MVQAIIISGVTCLVLILSILFFPKITIKNFHINTYIVVALLGAMLMLSFNIIPFDDLKDKIFSNTSVNPIKILVLFFSMTIISIYLDEVGFFKYIAYKSVGLAKTNQFVLFIIIYSFASLLTIFTSNDIVILTFIPFICYFCKNANINPIPYLVGCFVGANTWSMMLIIGNPTNIYLATSYNITFLSYFNVMFLPTILAGLSELLIIILIFRNSLKKIIEVQAEDYHIESKFNLIVGLSHLIICLIFLVISSYINIEMYLISFICALSLIIINLISSIFTKHKPTNLFNSVKRLPYELIIFVLSMFVIVEGLSVTGFTTMIYNAFGDNLAVFKYGYSSFLLCDLINNIPMSVLYANIPNMTLAEVYASIIGSNIGAFLTPIGALAGIMFTSLLSKYKIKYRFIDFVKYGIIISIPTITISLLILSIEL